MFSDASLPESSRMSSGFSVSCLHSSMVSLRKSGVSFWQCCFPIRSSRLTRYPSVPIYAIIGAYPSKPLCRYGIRLPYWISNCQRGLYQYRQEQSRYPGLSALCAFHAACRHLPAGCLCAGLIFNKTAFSKYLPYEYQTTGSNEPLIAEFNVYFLHCTASAYLLILSLYRIMHDDTVKKQNFV